MRGVSLMRVVGGAKRENGAPSFYTPAVRDFSFICSVWGEGKSLTAGV